VDPTASDAAIAQTSATLQKYGVPFELLTTAELRMRFPQFSFSSERIGIFEPESGALYARRAVRAVVEEAIHNGVDYFRDAVRLPLAAKCGRNRVKCCARTPSSMLVVPGYKNLSEILGGRIRPTRQEVIYFGPPAGSRQFAPPELPIWIDFSSDRGEYVLPDLENRGVKVALTGMVPHSIQTLAIEWYRMQRKCEPLWLNDSPR